MAAGLFGSINCQQHSYFAVIFIIVPKSFLSNGSHSELATLRYYYLPLQDFCSSFWLPKKMFQISHS